MNDQFKVYIDRLKSDHTEVIQFVAEKEFLNILDEDLSFPDPVSITGKAYLADDQLIIHLVVTTKAVLPCLMCNEPVKVVLELTDFYHVEPTEDIKDGFFDYSEPLREAIIMEAPKYVECHNGKCPNRSQLKKFNHKPEETTFPFSNL